MGSELGLGSRLGFGSGKARRGSACSCGETRGDNLGTRGITRKLGARRGSACSCAPLKPWATALPRACRGAARVQRGCNEGAVSAARVQRGCNEGAVRVQRGCNEGAARVH